MMFRIRSELIDELLGLRASSAVGLTTENAVDALPIDHDVDGEAAVAIRKAIENYAVFGNLVAECEGSHRGAG